MRWRRKLFCFQLKGILTDSYGAVIGFSAATVSLDGTALVGHPDVNGAFSLTAPPGSYTLRGVYKNVPCRILLAGTKSIALLSGKPLDIGSFALSDSALNTGWGGLSSR